MGRSDMWRLTNAGWNLVSEIDVYVVKDTVLRMYVMRWVWLEEDKHDNMIRSSLILMMRL